MQLTGEHRYLSSYVRKGYGSRNGWLRKTLLSLALFVAAARVLFAAPPGDVISADWIPYTGFLLALLVLVFFLIRENRIKKQYHGLKKELSHRLQEMNRQEQELSQQKEKLRQQIELSEEQNRLIHKQAIKLDKHRHSLEKAVEARTNELVIAKEKAEESDRLKTAFLENISHEIRTPMNAIMGFASLLGFPDITKDEQEKYVLRINKNCTMLLHLIDGILDMSQLQAGQLTIVKSAFSVNKLLKDMYQEYLAEHRDLGVKNISVELNLPVNGKDYLLYSDPIRVQQILQNLLSNATKYTEKGTIRFGYLPLYDSDYDKEPSKLQFYVEDTGIGIPPDKSELIFDWFNKIEEDKTKLYRGAGLGLFLSKEILNLLSGRIWFNSKVNEGSTFYFTLPFMNTSDLEPPAKIRKGIRREEDIVKHYDWRKKTILIVEDEQNNIVYLSEIIRRTGASVLEALSGEKAVKLVDSHKEISLVLMDLMMPEMNGYQATRHIKKMRPQLPVIAQTAYTNAREKEKSLEAGCDGYISKPYNPPKLLSLIDNFL